MFPGGHEQLVFGAPPAERGSSSYRPKMGHRTVYAVDRDEHALQANARHMRAQFSEVRPENTGERALETDGLILSRSARLPEPRAFRAAGRHSLSAQRRGRIG
jgi:hypothetical protein